MQAFATVALLLCLSCGSRDAEISALQQRFDEHEPQLRDARASATAWQKTAEAREQDAKREKARADELDERMKKIAEVVERIRPHDGRTGVTIASAIDSAGAQRSTTSDRSEWQQLEAAKTSAVQATQSVQGSTSIEVIRHFCEQKWASNFEMRSYCEGQQNEAVGKLNARSAATAGMTPRDFDAVRSACAAKWPDNFEMRDYCEEQQSEAYHKLQH